VGTFELGKRAVELVENKVRSGMSITQREVGVLESRYTINSQRPMGGMVRITQATPRDNMKGRVLRPNVLKK